MIVYRSELKIELDFSTKFKLARRFWQLFNKRTRFGVAIPWVQNFKNLDIKFWRRAFYVQRFQNNFQTSLKLKSDPTKWVYNKNQTWRCRTRTLTRPSNSRMTNWPSTTPRRDPPETIPDSFWVLSLWPRNWFDVPALHCRTRASSPSWPWTSTTTRLREGAGRGPTLSPQICPPSKRFRTWSGQTANLWSNTSLWTLTRDTKKVRSLSSPSKLRTAPQNVRPKVNRPTGKLRRERRSGFDSWAKTSSDRIRVSDPTFRFFRRVKRRNARRRV